MKHLPELIFIYTKSVSGHGGMVDFLCAWKKSFWGTPWLVKAACEILGLEGLQWGNKPCFQSRFFPEIRGEVQKFPCIAAALWLLCSVSVLWIPNPWMLCVYSTYFQLCGGMKALGFLHTMQDPPLHSSFPTPKWAHAPKILMFFKQSEKWMWEWYLFILILFSCFLQAGWVKPLSLKASFM